MVQATNPDRISILATAAILTCILSIMSCSTAAFPVKSGTSEQDVSFSTSDVDVGKDWAQSVSKYWLAHRYYPAQAAQAQEQGTVHLMLSVDHLGRVKSVEITGRSGSYRLDLAAVSTWRNAQLAPLPASVSEQTINMSMTITYTLLPEAKRAPG